MNGSIGTRTPSSLSLASTATSHISSDWQASDIKKDGKSFKQSVSNLQRSSISFLYRELRYF